MSLHPRPTRLVVVPRLLAVVLAMTAGLVHGLAVAAPASAVPTPRPGTSARSAPAPAPALTGVRWGGKTPRTPVVHAPPVTPAPVVPAPVPVVTTDPAALEVVRLVNLQRALVPGCPALRIDARLEAAARLHSEDMARHGYFSHTSLDGRSPWDRIAAQGYTGATGENIAAGYATPAATMTGWMNSPGHRANILNCTSRAIGVGLGRGGTYGIYWTQTFGRS